MGVREYESNKAKAGEGNGEPAVTRKKRKGGGDREAERKLMSVGMRERERDGQKNRRWISKSAMEARHHQQRRGQEFWRTTRSVFSFRSATKRMPEGCSRG